MQIINHEKTVRKMIGIVVGCGIEIDTWWCHQRYAKIITMINMRHMSRGRIFKDRWREWEEPLRLEIDFEEEKLTVDVHGSGWMGKAEEIAKGIQELLPKMDIIVQLTQTGRRELSNYVISSIGFA